MAMDDKERKAMAKFYVEQSKNARLKAEADTRSAKAAEKEAAMQSSIATQMTAIATAKQGIVETTNKEYIRLSKINDLVSKRGAIEDAILANKVTLQTLQSKTLASSNVQLGIDNARVATAQASYNIDQQRKILADKSFIAQDLAAQKINKTAEYEKSIYDYNLKQELKNDKNIQAQDEMLRQLEKKEEYDKARVKNLEKIQEIIQQANDLASDPKLAATFFGTTMLNNALSFGHSMKGMAGDLGVSRDQMMGIAGDTALASGFGLKMGASAKEIGEAYGGIASVSGPMTGDMADMAINASEMAHRLKISGAEAGKLFALTSMIEGGTAETAEASLKTVENLARGANVPIGKVMSDVAASADLIADYGFDNVEALGKAAVEAAKMGTSLDQMGKTASKLMDIDNARTEAMQLSVILGRQINVDRAQQLIYSGDLEAGYKEMLGQLGGIQGFNQMDYFQKQQAAQMMGVSTGELQKQLNLAAGLQESGEKQATGAAKYAGYLSDSFDHMTENATTYASMLSLMKSMGSTKIFQSIGGAVAGVGKSIAAKFGLGGGASKAAAGPLTKLGKPDMRFAANKGAIDKAGPMSDKISKVKGPGKQGNIISRFFNSFKKVDWSSIMKAVVGMALMGVALIAFVPPFKMFGEIPAQGILAGIGTLFAMTLAMKMMGKASGEIVKGAFGLLLMGVALLPAAYAFSLIAGVPMGAMWNFAAVLTVLGLAFAGIGYLGTLPIGALGLLIMAPAMIGAALAFQMVAGLPMGEMWNFAAVLTVLGLAFAGIGFLPTIFIGALGMLAAVPAIIGVAWALSFTKGLDPTVITAFGLSVAALGLTVAAMGLTGPLILMGAIGMLAMVPGIIGLAYALSFTSGLDPATILAFGTAVGMLGVTMAIMGMTGPLILMGALGMIAMIPGVIGLAYALSFTEGLDPKTILAFAAAVGMIGVTMAGLGMVYPLLIAGSLGMLAMTPGVMAISYALGFIPKDLDIMNFALGLGVLSVVGVALIPASVGIAMFSLSLLSLSLALLALSPVLGTLSTLVGIGGSFASLLGFDKEENEDGETVVKANSVIVSGPQSQEGLAVPGSMTDVMKNAGEVGILKTLFMKSVNNEAEVRQGGGNTPGGAGATVQREDRTQSQLADEIVKKIGSAEFKVFLDGKKVNKALYNPAGT
tara:strand:- start:197 stop:3688 length:3492 start_codon:yes stop_codon:yes gene_type:complete